MKILLADSNHPILEKTLIENGFNCDLIWDKSITELIKLLPNYDALILRSKFKITKEIIDNNPQLKCIGRVGAGMENIEVAYAESKNIKCVCVPEGNKDAVGEHAIGMLLMLLNNLKKADNEVRNGIWLRAENRGFELKNKTIGIIGYGNMGQSFAKKLSGFDCEILAYDKYKNVEKSYAKESTLEKIFEESDLVSLHLPLTVETHYYCNKNFISSFKKNIYIINTARGKCLNTFDLVEGLKNGKILGACLDVLEYETSSFENINTDKLPAPFQYLINSDNVILSPHIAGWTHESNYRMSELIAKKVIEVLRK